MNEIVRAVIAIALLVAMFAIGMHLPMYATKTAWILHCYGYICSWHQLCQCGF